MGGVSQPLKIGPGVLGDCRVPDALVVLEFSVMPEPDCSKIYRVKDLGECLGCDLPDKGSASLEVLAPMCLQPFKPQPHPNR